MKNTKTEPAGYAGMAAAVIGLTLVVALVIWVGWNLLVPPHMITYVQAIGAALLIDLGAAFRYAFSEGRS